MKAFPLRHSFRMPVCALAAFASLYVGCSDSSTSPPPQDAGPDRDGGQADTGTEPDAEVDAGPPSCQLDKPFGQPELVPGIPVVRAAHLSRDELKVYVNGGDLDGHIGFATRANRKDAFGPLQKFANLTDIHGEGVRLTPDEKTIYYTSYAGVRTQIYASKRDSADAEFPAGAPLPDNINSPGFTVFGAPYVRGNEFWFVANMGFARRRILRATLLPGGGFNDPEAVKELQGPVGEEHFPVLSADGLTIYFAATKEAPGGLVTYYVHTAKRTRTDGAFDQPTELTELTTPSSFIGDHYGIWPYWVSPDGCRLYLGHSDGDPNGRRLYVASRPEPILADGESKIRSRATP